jgi:hypothetical protein
MNFEELEKYILQEDENLNSKLKTLDYNKSYYNLIEFVECRIYIDYNINYDFSNNSMEISNVFYFINIYICNPFNVNININCNTNEYKIYKTDFYNQFLDRSLDIYINKNFYYTDIVIELETIYNIIYAIKNNLYKKCMTIYEKLMENNIINTYKNIKANKISLSKLVQIDESIFKLKNSILTFEELYDFTKIF